MSFGVRPTPGWLRWTVVVELAEIAVIGVVAVGLLTIRNGGRGKTCSGWKEPETVSQVSGMA